MQSNVMDRLWLVLRIGAAGCFIGHGAFGLIGKSAWLPYFAFVGIGPDLAWTLMPMVGVVDITAGLLALVSPRPVVFLYMSVWALWTALLRPLTGDHFAETLERAGNYGVPMALLVMMNWPTTIRAWFQRVGRRDAASANIPRVAAVLVGASATLLIGHALLGLDGKALLSQHYREIGIDGANAAVAVGRVELMLALALFAFPSAGLAALVAGWKVASESLFLAAGSPIWEFIERFGSYAAPLAVMLLALHYRLPRLAFSGFAARSRVVAAVLGLYGVSGLTPLGAQSTGDSATPAAPSDTELLERLRRGGLTLACRHAITDHSNEDRMPIDYSNRSAQRNLSPDGEVQARALGVAISEARIPVGAVYSNPLFRTRETATLAFGRADVIDTLGTSGVLARLLKQSVPAGANRVFVTRIGMLNNAFRGMVSGGFEEGDCAVVETDSASYRVLAKVRPDAFAKWAKP